MKNLVLFSAFVMLAGCGYTVDTGPRTPSQLPTVSGGMDSVISRTPRPPPETNGSTTVTAVASPLEVGTMLDEFDIQTPDRTLDTRISLRQGSVVLVFFIGEWCMYCKRQLQEFESQLATFRSLNADVWAVSSEGTETSRSLARSLHLSFPVAGDPDVSTIARFGVLAGGTGTAQPSVFILTRDGTHVRVAWRKIGAAQDDRADMNEILAALRALQPAAAPH